MKNFYFYIFILLTFIFIMSYINTYREPFNSGKQTIVLLGDSIFQNKAYVSTGKSVEELFREKTDNKTICLAVDHSKIIDIYSQIEKIPDELNNGYTNVFLSAGGNDILTHYVDQGNDITDTQFLDSMFSEYKNLLKSIYERIPDANIVLLDIYYPNNSTYAKYQHIISEWNKKIYDFARENNYSVIRVSTIITKPEDFAFGIEPSQSGGQKLVQAILSSF